MRVLIVEDEVKIAQFTCQALEQMSYSGDIAQTGQRARELFSHIDYDLVVLDLMLPDDHGLNLCKDFKGLKSHIPILVISTLSQIHDKVLGLDSGANDYITKPFHIDEFYARVRALLRRQDERGITLKYQDLELDLVKHQAIRDGQYIKLTSKEFALLEYFMRNTGRPLTRTQIAQHVWDLNFDPESNIVDVYIKQLRKKIDLPGTRKLIKTIIGLGYVLGDENL